MVLQSIPPETEAALELVAESAEFENWLSHPGTDWVQADSQWTLPESHWGPPGGILYRRAVFSTGPASNDLLLVDDTADLRYLQWRAERLGLVGQSSMSKKDLTTSINDEVMALELARHPDED